MTQETQATLNRFVNGDISWRAACAALELWDYDALCALLEENNMAPPAPLRENHHAALQERIIATVSES